MNLIELQRTYDWALAAYEETHDPAFKRHVDIAKALMEDV